MWFVVERDGVRETTHDTLYWLVVVSIVSLLSNASAAAAAVAVARGDAIGRRALPRVSRRENSTKSLPVYNLPYTTTLQLT